MSMLTDAWLQLYAAQTEWTGSALTATVTGYATSKPAIRTEVEIMEQLFPGGTGDAGGFTIQMLRSDLSALPPEDTAVTVSDGRAGVVLGIRDIDGVTYLQIGDRVANP